jgi:hypothetical protein
MHLDIAKNGESLFYSQTINVQFEKAQYFAINLHGTSFIPSFLFDGLVLLVFLRARQNTQISLFPLDCPTLHMRTFARSLHPRRFQPPRFRLNSRIKVYTAPGAAVVGGGDGKEGKVRARLAPRIIKSEFNIAVGKRAEPSGAQDAIERWVVAVLDDEGPAAGAEGSGVWRDG